MTPVVVTGVGVVSAAGVSEATLFDATGFGSRRAAEVAGFDARAHFRTPKALKLTDRRTRLSVAASALAVADAAWPLGDDGSDDLGVLVGTSGSDLQAPELAHAVRGDADARCASDVRAFAERILDGLNPLWLLVNLPNMASAHVAIQLGARGPNSTVMTDWIAGLQALGEAADWIRAGEARAVLAGGADTAVQPFAFAALEQAGLVDADGAFVPGEGGAMFLVEDAAEAARRGATVRATIAGAAVASGADALRRALAGALDEAGWSPRSVTRLALASPHRPPFDAAEAAAVSALFGSEPPPRIDLTRGLGHALAAAAPLELAAALREGPGCVLVAAQGWGGPAAAVAARV